MATYNLSLLSVLIVEDNRYMRTLLRTILHALGVGNVAAVGDGGEAIDLLRGLKEGKQTGVATIDMVFTNWQMEPVDGTMLLKWIRRHKESPDRFMPVIMVSGFGDAQRVAHARDLGVTEFLGKPFSIDSLMARIMSMVDTPRQFVLCDSYFGPDRRRSKRAISGPNRRVMPEDDIQIIYDDR